MRNFQKFQKVHILMNSLAFKTQTKLTFFLSKLVTCCSGLGMFACSELKNFNFVFNKKVNLVRRILRVFDIECLFSTFRFTIMLVLFVDLPNSITILFESTYNFRLFKFSSLEDFRFELLKICFVLFFKIAGHRW